MRVLPAALALGLAVVIFLVMGLLVAWGWNRGYSDDALYAKALWTLAGFAVPVVSSLVMLIAAWRKTHVPFWIIGIVLLSAGLAVAGSVWSLVNDPGDAFWVVPPLLGYAVCSVWSVLIARGQTRAEQ